jgi:uncharacterized membrane protein
MEENVRQGRGAQVYAGAAALGAIAGMRSMAAPATLGHLKGRAATFEKPAVARTLLALSVGEFIADKLPFLPKRTKTGSLVLRMASGAICGAIFCSALKRSGIGGAVAGGSAALGATYVFYKLRHAASEQLGVPDPAVALAEDAVAAFVGLTISRIAGSGQRANLPGEPNPLPKEKDVVKREVRELAELRRHPLS